MDTRKFGNALAVVALVFFVVAIIGTAAGGSHLWVEAFEAAGWMFFVGTILVLYLETDRLPEEERAKYAGWTAAAWGFGVLAIVLFFISMIANLSTVIQ